MVLINSNEGRSVKQRFGQCVTPSSEKFEFSVLPDISSRGRAGMANVFSSLNIRPGQQISLKDLPYALLVAGLKIASEAAFGYS